MFRPRVIPVLLLKGQVLYKSKKFKDHRYIGDPINAVKIFNDLTADELVFLDITASAENRLVSLEVVRDIGEEANMPFAVGGGIRTLEDIRAIIGAGAEKVVINKAAAEDPDFIQSATNTFGTSTIAICMDIKRKLLGKEQVWIQNGSKATGLNPVDYAKKMEDLGVGEIIVQSIDHDGQMNGYHIDLIRKVSEAVSVPVVALGGAWTREHLKQAYEQGYASAMAAGSMFVYHGPRKGVLVNYPERDELDNLFK